MRKLMNDLSRGTQLAIKAGAVIAAISSMIALWNVTHSDFAKAYDTEQALATIEQRFLWLQRSDIERTIGDYELQQLMEDEQKYKDYYQTKIDELKAELAKLDEVMEETFKVK